MRYIFYGLQFLKWSIFHKHFSFNTDILFGKNCNLKTMLVLTGVTKMEDLEEYASSLDEEKHNLLPDYYLPSLDDIINLLKDFSS